MKSADCLLVADGSTDRVLIDIVKWVIATEKIPVSLSFELFCPTMKVAEKLEKALIQYPSTDVVFIHRDAENEPWENRQREIEAAIQDDELTLPHVSIIPIRMTEAWLCIDEQAIRRAAGNPNGKTSLKIPAPSKLEGIPDPKEALNELLLKASELNAKRRKKIKKPSELAKMRRLVAANIHDFSILGNFETFRFFQEQTIRVFHDLPTI